MNTFYEKITNNKLFILADKIAGLMTLSVLWFVCSIPIVTIGASSAALYYAINRRFSLESESPSKDFWHSFKQNLRQGIILSLIYEIYIAICTCNSLIGYFGFGSFKLPSWYFPFSFVMLIPIIFSLPVTFAYLAKFSDSVKTILMNSFTFCMISVKNSLLLFLLIIVSLGVMIGFPPSILILPSVSCYINYIVTNGMFTRQQEIASSRTSSDKSESSVESIKSNDTEDLVENEVDNEE